MDDKKTLTELEQLFAAGDAWLRKYGIVSPVQHNAIVLNLYMAFPKCRYVEYFMTRPPERKIHVILHFPFFRLLFSNRDKIVDDAIGFLKEYLHEYTITVELKRYRKGAEKHETPNPLADAAVTK